MLGICSVPIADLRAAPELLLPRDFSHHPKRESQLLFGECVRLLERRGQWLRVEALEQLRYREELGWHPYPGWIHEGEFQEGRDSPLATQVVFVPWIEDAGRRLGFGTYLPFAISGATRPLGGSFNRNLLFEDAQHFLDTPYLWGGRGAYCPDPVSGCDCSSLVQLLYRAQGVPLPRDAHDQFLHCRKIPKESLLPGDLIFLEPLHKPGRITHVLLFRDEATLLESPETGKSIRWLPFRARDQGGPIQLSPTRYLAHLHYGSPII